MPCSSVWPLHCNKHIHHLEAVQRGTVRFAMNCYESVLIMLLKLNWPTLQDHKNEKLANNLWLYTCPTCSTANLHTLLQMKSPKVTTMYPVTRKTFIFPSTVNYGARYQLIL